MILFVFNIISGIICDTDLIDPNSDLNYFLGDFSVLLFWLDQMHLELSNSIGGMI